MAATGVKTISRLRRFGDGIATLGLIVVCAVPTGAGAVAMADPVGARLAGTNPVATVLTLEPLDLGTDDLTNIMAGVLEDFADTAGRIQQRVSESSNLTYAGLMSDAATLNTAIMSTPGPKIVLGWSRGAQVASEWLQNDASASGAPSSATLSFVLIGNPQRRLGGKPGATTLDGVALQPTPDTTQYTVTDISRRWDGWSNWDDWPAMLPSDQARLILGQIVDHANYSQVSVSNPTNMTRAVVGHTTYVVTTQ